MASLCPAISGIFRTVNTKLEPRQEMSQSRLAGASVVYCRVFVDLDNNEISKYLSKYFI